jgi:hypothetical protein
MSVALLAALVMLPAQRRRLGLKATLALPGLPVLLGLPELGGSKVITDYPERREFPDHQGFLGKLMPRPFHPKRDIAAQKAFKEMVFPMP